VPTFAEVLAVTKAIDYFEVEVKADEPSRIEALVPLLIDDDSTGPACARRSRSSRSTRDACVLCHRLAPDMMLSLITPKTTDAEIEQALALGCDGIAGWVDTATEGFVDRRARAGVEGHDLDGQRGRRLRQHACLGRRRHHHRPPEAYAERLAAAEIAG